MKEGAIYQESESFWCLTRATAVVMTAALQNIGGERVHVGYKRVTVGYRVIVSVRVDAQDD